MFLYKTRPSYEIKRKNKIKYKMKKFNNEWTNFCLVLQTFYSWLYRSICWYKFFEARCHQQNKQFGKVWNKFSVIFFFIFTSFVRFSLFQIFFLYYYFFCFKQIRKITIFMFCILLVLHCRQNCILDVNWFTFILGLIFFLAIPTLNFYTVISWVTKPTNLWTRQKRN